MRRRVSANYGQMDKEPLGRGVDGEGSAGEDSQNETKTDRHDHCQFVGGIGGGEKPVLDDIRKAIPKFDALKIQKKSMKSGKETHLKIEEFRNRILGEVF